MVEDVFAQESDCGILGNLALAGSYSITVKPQQQPQQQQQEQRLPSIAIAALTRLAAVGMATGVARGNCQGLARRARGSRLLPANLAARGGSTHRTPIGLQSRGGFVYRLPFRPPFTDPSFAASPWYRALAILGTLWWCVRASQSIAPFARTREAKTKS